MKKIETKVCVFNLEFVNEGNLHDIVEMGS